MELHKKVRKYIETKESKHSKPSKESCLPPDFNWESYEKKNRNKYTYHNNNYLTLKEQKACIIYLGHHSKDSWVSHKYEQQPAWAMYPRSMLYS